MAGVEVMQIAALINAYSLESSCKCSCISMFFVFLRADTLTIFN
jgi:hypothetical protein